MAAGLDQLWAGWREQYVTSSTAAERDQSFGACVFCEIAASGRPSADNNVVWRGRWTYAVLNAYPYASGHLLVVPARHVGDLAQLSPTESAELWESTRSAVEAISSAYAPDGANIGANLGRAAGAGIPRHVHMHVLPRWSGDTNFMTSVAGVRVMPEPLSSAWQKLAAAWPR